MGSILVKKTIAISGVLLAIALIVFWFVFSPPVFWSILFSAVLVFGLFVANLYLYSKLYGDAGKLKFMFAAFWIKLLVLAGVFFGFTRLTFVDIYSLFLSFIILFTVFLFLELFLLYKNAMFKT